MELLLEVIEGASTGKFVRLNSGQHITVGRTTVSEFVVPDPRVGRRHFRIELTPFECRIHDLASRNGTFLNRQKITDAVLRDGDTIIIGGSAIHVTIFGANVGCQGE
jgi:pSer/pThr/pTyr-binding forkhead associated (FHA) protein